MTQCKSTLPYLVEQYREDTTQYTFQGLPIDGMSAPELRAILVYLINCEHSRAELDRKGNATKKWGTA